MRWRRSPCLGSPSIKDVRNIFGISDPPPPHPHFKLLLSMSSFGLTPPLLCANVLYEWSLSGRQAGRQMDALINERAERATQLRVSQSLRFFAAFCPPARPCRCSSPAFCCSSVSNRRAAQTRLHSPTFSRPRLVFLPMGSVNPPPPPLGEVEAPKATDYPGVSLTINEEGGKGAPRGLTKERSM